MHKLIFCHQLQVYISFQTHITFHVSKKTNSEIKILLNIDNSCYFHFMTMCVFTVEPGAGKTEVMGSIPRCNVSSISQNAKNLLK